MVREAATRDEFEPLTGSSTGFNGRGVSQGIGKAAVFRSGTELSPDSCLHTPCDATRHGWIDASCVLNGPADGDAFRVEVERFLEQTPAPKEVAVMDHLHCRKERTVRRAIRQTGAHLPFLPPCSPELNPIKQVFNKPEHLQRIGDLPDRFPPEECANHFGNSGCVSKKSHRAPVPARVTSVGESGEYPMVAQPELRQVWPFGKSLPLRELTASCCAALICRQFHAATDIRSYPFESAVKHEVSGSEQDVALGPQAFQCSRCAVLDVRPTLTTG